jgi:hypothetical protein
LLMSFVAFALSRTLLKAGITSAAKMATVAITMSNSISVNARSTGGGELWAMDWDSEGMILRLASKRKAKRAEKARLLDNAFSILCM